MKRILANDTLQLELTNFCPNDCANCSRFCSLVPEPYFMDYDFFKECVDSLEGFPRMIGFQGGEVLYHPDFEKMTEYARSKFSKEQLGLWSIFPKGKEYLREEIVNTFGHVFLNSHERQDIMHFPFLVSSREVLKEDHLIWNAVDDCPFQRNWSASLSPRGAFACEMMSSLSILFDYGEGWPIEKGWWWRTPKDYRLQIETFCPRCGGSLSLKMRSSLENKDDISLNNYLALKNKVRNLERFVIHNLETFKDTRPLAMYKDFSYRNNIARNYGIFLTINEKGFWSPHLYNFFDPNDIERRAK